MPTALCDRCIAVECKNVGTSERAYNLVLISRTTAAVTMAQEILKAGFSDDALS